MLSDSAGDWQMKHSISTLTVLPQEQGQERGSEVPADRALKAAVQHSASIKRQIRETWVRSIALPMSPSTVMSAGPSSKGAEAEAHLPGDVEGHECNVRWRDLGLVSLEKRCLGEWESNYIMTRTDIFKHLFKTKGNICSSHGN